MIGVDMLLQAVLGGVELAAGLAVVGGAALVEVEALHVVPHPVPPPTNLKQTVSQEFCIFKKNIIELSFIL